MMLFEHIPQFVFPVALAAAPALRNLRNLLSFVHIQARDAMQNASGGNVLYCGMLAACLPRLISAPGTLRGTLRYPRGLIAARPPFARCAARIRAR